MILHGLDGRTHPHENVVSVNAPKAHGLAAAESLDEVVHEEARHDLKLVLGGLVPRMRRLARCLDRRRQRLIPKLLEVLFADLESDRRGSAAARIQYLQGGIAASRGRAAMSAHATSGLVYWFGTERSCMLKGTEVVDGSRAWVGGAARLLGAV